MTDDTEDSLDLQALRFPIGPCEPRSPLSAPEREAFVDAIARLPTSLRSAVGSLIEDQLDTPYRPQGWTVRQVVHHLADSHMNSYVRFKLAVTEDEPTIRPYDEAAWGDLEDARSGPVGPSLDLLEALHARWTMWLHTLDEAAWSRRFRHPEADAWVTLDENVQIYAWHGRHHLAHVTGLAERKGW